MPDDLRAWRELGEYRRLCGHRIFTVDLPALAPGVSTGEPLAILHGFPTSSFDFHRVVGQLRRDRRVLLLDLLGYGFSDKPDLPYTLEGQADIVAAFLADLGVDACALLSHDMGDSVAGELLARSLEGRWPVSVTRRVLTNGSIYLALAHLTDGQQLLLALPDARLPEDLPLDAGTLAAGLAATFSPATVVDPAELADMAACVTEGDGQRILPRLIRYVEQRRRHEARYTGAIEGHPSPLTVVWGADDPVAVAPMVDRLAAVVPSAAVVWLDDVGHYPMVEAPDRFTAAVLDALAEEGPGPSGSGPPGEGT